MICVPEQAEMAVDIGCKTALAQRGESQLTIPIDVQEKKLNSQFSRDNVAYHTSDVYVAETIPSPSLIEEAAKILNGGSRIVILVGQGALGAGNEVLAVAEKLCAPVVKALLGKAAIPDDNQYSLGDPGLLGTEPSSDAMSDADTLLMVGTSFPYIEYLPKPGQARGIQIDIKSEKIGLRYPVEIGLVGDSRLALAALLPLLNQKYDLEFLKSKQQSMKNWNKLMKEISTRTDKPIKPQVIAVAVSDELEENAIISVDCGTNTTWAARYIYLRKGMKFSLSGTLATMACGLPYEIAAQIAFPETIHSVRR